MLCLVKSIGLKELNDEMLEHVDVNNKQSMTLDFCS